jgi:DoxX-like family
VNTAVWIVQILLVFAFITTGMIKISVPYEKLTPLAGWVGDFSPISVKRIGALELLGAAGIILPALSNMFPWLTSLAAAGLVLDMLAAMAVHFRRKEFPLMILNLTLILLALFVIYARLAVVPL